MKKNAQYGLAGNRNNQFSGISTLPKVNRRGSLSGGGGGGGEECCKKDSSGNCMLFCYYGCKSTTECYPKPGGAYSISKTRPNVRYGLAGTNPTAERFSKTLGTCKLACKMTHPFKKEKRDACIAGCEAKWEIQSSGGNGGGYTFSGGGGGGYISPEGSGAGSGTGSGAGNVDEDNKTTALIKNILYGFLVLALLLILIWAGYAIYKKVTKK